MSRRKTQETFTDDVWQAIEQAFENLEDIQGYINSDPDEERNLDASVAADDLGLLLLDIGYHIDPARMKTIREPSLMVQGLREMMPNQKTANRRRVNKKK